MKQLIIIIALLSFSSCITNKKLLNFSDKGVDSIEITYDAYFLRDRKYFIQKSIPYIIEIKIIDCSTCKPPYRRIATINRLLK